MRSDAPSNVPPVGPPPVPRALVDLQSLQRCRVCRHVKQYCQQVGHVFTPIVTCESCVHMGRQYWGDSDFPVHFCDRSDERRRATFRPSGDFAEDFMSGFRTFFDAGPKQTNCGRFFEAKPLAQTSTGNRKDGSAPQTQDPA